jgi:hypothetical protein
VIEKAFIQSALILEQLKEKKLLGDYAIIGAFALARVATPRATGDIDYAIKRGSASLDGIAQHVSGVSRIGELNDPLAGTVSFEVESDGVQWPVQLIEFPKGWERIAFEGIEIQEVGRVAQRFVSPKALILLKLYAGSALDLSDARQILELTELTEEELSELHTLATRLRVNQRLQKILPRASD